MNQCALPVGVDEVSRPKLSLIKSKVSGHPVGPDGAEMLAEGNWAGADTWYTEHLSGSDASAEMWMAAGLARLHLGRFRSARSAFVMSAWMNDDPVARKLARTLDDLLCE